MFHHMREHRVSVGRAVQKSARKGCSEQQLKFIEPLWQNYEIALSDQPVSSAPYHALCVIYICMYNMHMCMHLRSFRVRKSSIFRTQ